MEKSRGIGFSGVFLVFFLVQKTTVTKTFRCHSKPLPPAPPPHSSLVLFTHPSIHPPLSLITTLSLSPSIVGLLLSLVEFQPFSLRFFFFNLIISLFVLSVFLFVRSPSFTCRLLQRSESRKERVKRTSPPVPRLKKKFSQMNIHLGSDG